MYSSSALTFPLLLMLLMTHSSMAAPQKTINVYTYHDKPPYVIYDSDINKIHSGIYFELIQHLNQVNADQEYKLAYLPRVRLERLLRDNKLNGVIIGVNPLWFGDKDKQRYLWSDPFMPDQDVFLVNAKSNIEFEQLSDLSGLTIALERGTYYKGISEMIDKNEIRLSTTNSSEQNLNMLAYNRADITIMSLLTAHYFFDHRYQKSFFSILKQPHDIFERFILIPKSMENLITPINKAIVTLNKNKNWLIKFDALLSLEDTLPEKNTNKDKSPL